ncbi:hypothetical protein VJY32_00040 [Ignavibacteria bacterium 4148-Me]|uniref:hypothetical protein n=1 Tax=Rosettibacter primus TaxID=3111523 RepID=UPI00336BDD4E
MIFNINLLAQSNYELGGYAKYLFSLSEVKGIDKKLIDNTFHSRLNFKWYPVDNFNLSLGIRNRIVIGDSPEIIPEYEKVFSSDNGIIKLNKIIFRKRNSINYLEIDRLWTDFNFDKVRLSLGKQRIAWGTSWVWNITDIFNPLSVLDFDYEEHQAVDAVRFQYFSSELSKFDLAFQLEKKISHTKFALQYSTNLSQYDFYFMIGSHKKRLMLGTAWAGDIFDAGFRGEIMVLNSPSRSNVSTNLYSKEERIQLSVVLSIDYTFVNSLYLHSEMLYNNIGKKENAALFRNDALELGMLSAGKLNLFYQIGYNITPLCRVDIISLHNVYDNSLVMLSTLSYNLMDNLDFSLIGIYFSGEDLDEYSPKCKMIFIRLKFSF